MAKGQKRSNREMKKTKKKKEPAGVPVEPDKGASPFAGSPKKG